MKRGMIGLMMFTVGCGLDLSLPTVTMRAPMAGSVMSSRVVRLAWDDANPGAASLCVNLFARRADDAPRHRRVVGARVTQIVLHADDLPPIPTFFWNVSDCALRPPVERWQVTVPLVGEAREAVVSGVRSDLDGDGHSDLFYARGATPDRTVRTEPSSFWRGTVFSVGRSSSSPDRPVRFRAAGDVDGDGFVDMLVLDGSLSIVYGGVYSELTAPVTLSHNVAPGTEVVAGRDLDGDGRAELVEMTARTLTIKSFAGRDTLRTVHEERVPFEDAAWEARWVSDHDGDGQPELLVNTQDPAGGCWLRWSAEGVRWTRVGGHTVVRELQSLGDLDGDEREDVAWVGAAGQLTACAGERFERCEHVGARVRAAVALEDRSTHERIPVTISDAAEGRFVVATHRRCDAARCAQTVATLDTDGSGVAPELFAVDDDGDGRSDLFARVTADRIVRITEQEQGDATAQQGSEPLPTGPRNNQPGAPTGRNAWGLAVSERLEFADPAARVHTAFVTTLQGDS